VGVIKKTMYFFLFFYFYFLLGIKEENELKYPLKITSYNPSSRNTENKKRGSGNKCRDKETCLSPVSVATAVIW